MPTPDALTDLDQPAATVAALSRAAPRSIPAGVVIVPTVGLSAFLLFAFEPLVGRLTLPTFGGAPGVWATILAFFQGVLLLGYAYGHLSVTRLGVRRGAFVHLVVAGVAAVALTFAPERVADLRNEALPPALDLLVILAITVGPGAFVLTATTPLLSAWYGATGGSADLGTAQPDPYWLYALSNAGSFAALLAYPFLIEPNLGLATQRQAWAVGFAVLWLLLAASAVVTSTRTSSRHARAAQPRSQPIEPARRIRWVLLAAIPSGLLAAVTNIIATDLISAPLLWVGPLAMYLLTFVVAFSERGRRIVPRARWLAPVAATLLWVPFGSAAGWPILPLLLLEYSGFAVVALALHGRLALDRPAPDRLTEFYLLLAAGGVLGGAFVAIVAPLAFKGIWEFPILLVGALAMLAWGSVSPWGADRMPAPSPDAPAPHRHGPNLRPFVAGARHRLLPYVAVAVPLGIALGAGSSVGLEAGVRWLLVGGLVLLVGGRPWFLALATALVLTLSVFVIPRDVVFRDRSFFGVTEVLQPAGATTTSLMNGTTLHGVQSTDPALRRTPMTYYARPGPVGDVFVMVEATGGRTADGTTQPRSIGVVGLGAGTLAAYVGPRDAMTFYEIDPVVVRVASDPGFFTYLADAPSRPSIVLGDARLSLAGVPDATHDLLVLDAFSSDTIPVHLLTVEAFREYARVLRPGGTLAIHVSNRYYDLAAPVAAAAERAGLMALVRSYTPAGADRAAGAMPSIWVAASGDPALVESLEARGWVLADGALAGWAPAGRASEPTGPAAGFTRPLTDDFADLLRFLRPGTW